MKDVTSSDNTEVHSCKGRRSSRLPHPQPSPKIGTFETLLGIVMEFFICLVFPLPPLPLSPVDAFLLLFCKNGLFLFVLFCDCSFSGQLLIIMVSFWSRYVQVNIPYSFWQLYSTVWIHFKLMSSFLYWQAPRFRSLAIASTAAAAVVSPSCELLREIVCGIDPKKGDFWLK